jgi:hypothetical protein
MDGLPTPRGFWDKYPSSSRIVHDNFYDDGEVMIRSLFRLLYKVVANQGISLYIYSNGFAQSIAKQRLDKHPATEYATIE